MATPPVLETDTTPPGEDTDIKPEERFEEIPEEEGDPTDMDHFLQLMRDQGIQTLQERGIKRTNATTSIIKHNYLMEPEVLPYQDILENKPKVATIKSESTSKQENPKTKIKLAISLLSMKPKIKPS